MTSSGVSRSLRTLPTRGADVYYYRRPVGARELLPAIGIGVAVGAAAFYVARLLLQRTPFEPLDRPTRLTSSDRTERAG